MKKVLEKQKFKVQRDYIKAARTILRVLILMAASFFVYIFTDRVEASCDRKLTITLQSDKEGGGSYLFLPSFAELSDVAVKVPGETEEFVFSEDGPAGMMLTIGGQTAVPEVWQSQNMPCIWIETDSSFEELEADKENESTGRLTVFSPTGKINFQGEISAMHGHGNSTWYENKKSWLIKLSGKASLLGMKPAKKWLLISNVKDPSMMRNKLFLDMAKECGLPGALSCEWADLYVNGEYQGLYLLSEKAEIASGRLEIGFLEEENRGLNGDVAGCMNYTVAAGNETLLQGWFLPENPKNIEGGYLLEMEYPVRYAAEPSKFVTRNGQNMVVKSPAYSSVEQIQYIYAFVQDFESALFAADGCVPSGEAVDIDRAGLSYTEFADIDSFAGRYVLDEISKNIDANSSSVFFYKPRYADRLYAGPVWDYDLALGNSGGWGEEENLHDPEGFYVNQAGWSRALYGRPEFREVVERCYQERYSPWLDDFLEEGYDKYRERIRAAAEMDNRYRGIDTWEGGAEEMRLFLEKRKRWLDREWGS